MPIYQGDKKIVDRYIGEKLIVRSYQGDKLIFDAYSELSGTLPLYVRSRASQILKNYIIYGTSEGVGVETGNLWDADEVAQIQVTSDASVVRYGMTFSGSAFSLCLISAEGPMYYKIKTDNTYGTTIQLSAGVVETIALTDNQTLLVYGGNPALVRQSIIQINGGASYIPYGYKLPLTVRTVNLFDVTKITENSIVDEEDGRVYARLAYNTSPLIAVDADSVYFNFSKSDDSRAMLRIAFYDENDSYLSFRHDTNVKSPKKFDLPTGAKKIRFSYTNGNGDGGTAQSAIQSIVVTDFLTDHYIPYYNTETPIYIGNSKLGEEEYVDYESGKVYKDIPNSFDKNATDTEKGYSVGYLVVNGNTSSTTTWRVSEYININQIAFGRLTMTVTANTPSICFYSSQKEFIPNASVAYQGRYEFVFEIPLGATYLRFSYYESSKDDVQLQLSQNNRFVTPTDPPVPLPDISLPQGIVTIDTEEEVKPQTTVKGRINPIHYAYHVDPTISNPSDAVTYLADAVGKAPASMGVSAFNYGDWADAFFMPKPCMLGFDGKVKYYLNPNDYSKKLDGTDSDYDNLAFEGNVMLEFPLIWWKYEAGEAEGEGYFHVSNVQIDDTYKCWCNINSKGEQINHFYMAAYNGCIYDGKMRSISGLQLLPWSTTAYSDTATYAVGARVHNGNKMYQCITAIEEAEPFDETKWEQFASNGQTSGQEEVNACIALNTNNSVEWYTDVYADRALINGLLTLIGKSLNTQAVFGRGLDSENQTAKENYTTGTLNNKGLFYGVTANGNNAVKVFGIENWWGCVWRRTAGLIGTSTGYKYKLTYDTSDGTTVSGYNSTANGYKVCNTQQPANGYVTKMQYGDWGFVPMTTSGTSTTYYSDYYYRGNGFALFGGSSGSGVICGAWSLDLSGGFASRSWDVAAAPSCKPLV